MGCSEVTDWHRDIAVTTFLPLDETAARHLFVLSNSLKCHLNDVEDDM